MKIISVNRCTPGYRICEENGRLSVSFRPADLVSESGMPIKGLERVYEERKEKFFSDLAKTAEIAANNFLHSCVSDYVINGEEIGSTFYAGENLNIENSIEFILSNFSGICSAMAEIKRIAPGADAAFSDIICEPENPGAFHILYVHFGCDRHDALAREMAGILIGKLKGSAASRSDLMHADIIIRQYIAHPLAKRGLEELAEILLDRSGTDWKKAAALSGRIKEIIELGSPFLLNQIQEPRSKSCTLYEKIGMTLNQGNMVVLFSDDDRAERAALGYAGYTGNAGRYIHIGKTDLSSGLYEAVLSEGLALNTPCDDFDSKLGMLQKICNESTLLIFTGFDGNVDFETLSTLQADIILTAKEDMSDYGLVSIRIPEV